MSMRGNIQGFAHLQNQNYLVTESLNVWFNMRRMATKIPMIFTAIMMINMMKYKSIKEYICTDR